MKGEQLKDEQLKGEQLKDEQLKGKQLKGEQLKELVVKRTTVLILFLFFVEGKLSLRKLRFKKKILK